MRHHRTLPRNRVIRRATPKDRPWIRDVAADVYADFGDYREIIPAWLAHPGVLTFVEESAAAERRGFILVGFYEPEENPIGGSIADLLAIAVSPQHQGAGVGRRLLRHAIDLATIASHQMTVPELRLTVADSNAKAQALFASEGFVVLDAAHGTYDGGQAAIRMRRPLAARAETDRLITEPIRPTLPKL